VHEANKNNNIVCVLKQLAATAESQYT